MAYLGLGDGQRAAVELVQAERMRQLNPRLITGRDLAKLSQGLVQLFGVPAGQLSIEETRGQVAAAPPAAPPVAVVPAPAPAPEDPPPAPNAPSVMVRGQVSATIAAPPAPEVTVVPPDGAAAEAPGAAPPPVIVIPEEQGAVIE
jgi:hypothetical protein